MRPSRQQVRISLAQLMILIAAVAIGFAWSRALAYNRRMLEQSFGFSMSYEDEMASRSGGWFGRYWVVARQGMPCLATSSIALAFLGIRSLRARPGRMSRQPGLIACIAATTVLIAGALQACINTFQGMANNDWKLEVYGPHYRFVWFEAIIPEVSVGGVSLGIAACWMVLLFSRRWKLGASWIDRSGVALAVLWLACGLVEAVAPWNLPFDRWLGIQ